MSRHLSTLLYVAITAVTIQCLALMSFIVWMLKNPADDTKGHTRQAISSMLAASFTPGADAQVGPSGGPGGGAGGGGVREKLVPTFDTEQEAVQDYVNRLTAAFDLDIVLSEGYALPSIRQSHEKATKCTSFSCESLDDLRLILVLTGRRIPPEPRWKDATEYNPEKSMIIEYLGVVCTEMTKLAEDENKPNMKPDAALTRKALACSSLECADLDAFIEACGAQLAAVGRSVPPKPAGLARGSGSFPNLTGQGAGMPMAGAEGRGAMPQGNGGGHGGGKGGPGGGMGGQGGGMGGQGGGMGGQGIGAAGATVPADGAAPTE